MTETGNTEIAAVDLGSNSFHMVVAKEQSHGLVVVDRLREMVRLASALGDDGHLSGDAVGAALECLERFGQRLRGLPRFSVRAVGTNTLRKAANSQSFLAKAREALGYPIDIISGAEEARLIYLGVSRTLEQGDGRRLVVDIGGGSTELIIGEQGKPLYIESLFMGCVSHSQTWFSSKISRGRMKKAITAASLEVEPIEVAFRRAGWTDVIGTSGTIRAVDRVVRESGWSESGITRDALEKLSDALIDGGHVENLSLPGLGPRRTPVFPGGVAVLLAIFRQLGIESMAVSNGSLREGVLHDLVGRIHHDDSRAKTVDELVRRFQIDDQQGCRVESTSLNLYENVRRDWNLDEADQLVLRSAARLHEIGLFVAHSQYHKHGAYLLQNMPMPGFSRQEQVALSILVRMHRRKFDPGITEAAMDGNAKKIEKLALLLRLATTLHRGRGVNPIPLKRISVSGRNIVLELPDTWLDEHPLTRADIDEDARYLMAADYRLMVEKA